MARFFVSFLIMFSSLAAAAGRDLPSLVDADWLQQQRQQSELVIVDIRSGIDNGGDRSTFRKAHIPGSVYSSYTDDGWRESRDGVTGVMPPVSSLERLISGLGINNGDTVVLVPAGTGPTDFGSAARVYWTFKVLGHDAVTILNGGFAGWNEAGFDVASGEGAQRPFGVFKGELRPELLATLEEVDDARQNQGQLVDARPADYFTGKEKSPATKAAGTIPGAMSLPHQNFLSQQGKVWYLNSDTIAGQLQSTSLDRNKRAIAFCNTAHWAATDWFVLSELAEFDEVALYDGSMAEWSQDSDRPMQAEKKGLARLLDVFN
jgi:thiosulfate/3-mercaptopyruvate sulfurtransferase